MSRCTFNVTEQPTIPDVYEVLVTLHGIVHPRPHETFTLYAYHDGIDSWGPWEFSRDSALRASGPLRSMSSRRRYPWKEILSKKFRVTIQYIKLKDQLLPPPGANDATGLTLKELQNEKQEHYPQL